MNKKALILIIFSLILLVSGACKDDNNPAEEGGGNTTKMSLSASSLNAAATQKTLTLQLNSQGNWKVSSDADWCVTNKLQGTGKASLTITLTPNETAKERIANLTFTDPTATLKVEITQSGEDTYKLPVIFHVLYANASDPKQNPDGDKLATILQICNQRFANTFADGDKSKKGVDTNLEFVMAPTDPSGKTLAEPGINRIKWATPVMDCDKFMSKENKEAIPLMWDLNKYINIFLYTFEKSNTLGISFMPYATSRHPLEGLYNGDRYFTNQNMSYPHCVSINNLFINELPTYNVIKSADVTTTLTHELAHFLGLIHAFGVDNEEQKKSWREDTDYCEDTPNYDRAGYEDWLYNEYYPNTPNPKISDVVKRISATGSQFNSHNIMDYAWSFANEFTPEQRKRMRHVLYYSPLIPGPKYDQPSTRAIMDAPIPPARTIK